MIIINQHFHFQQQKKRFIRMEWSNQHFYRNFTPKTNKNIENILGLLGWKIFTIGQDRTMNFSHQYVNSQKIISFLQAIEETKIECLALNYNKTPKICETISSIHFSNLKNLSISGNKIISLESLQHVQSNQITLLLLDNNLLTSIRCLSKMNLVQLQTLIISHNRLSAIADVIISLDSPNLSKIECEGNNCNEYLLMLIKMQSNAVTYIDLKNNGVVMPELKSVKMAILMRMPTIRKYLYS